DLFLIQQRQREILSLLHREGYFPLTSKRILEIGCASGGVLREFLSYGATPYLLHGAELEPCRIANAKAVTPHLPLISADGRSLPYPDSCFDMVMQFTVFSSILNEDIKRAIADEMRRVLRPGGLILWYDFWLNPINPEARGISLAEIRRLFPGCRISFRRLSLAAPLARRLAPYSWLACYLLDRLRIFNTHYLAVIRPE
ncbi:MAG: class I SAM-dependent methyltransferase, partial [Acidobacteria bacterium]|nr:class I SAM-dependent methyltransferase [Acidobacteriota bacterium]